MTSYGKHEGDLPGAPATGNDLKMTSITIHRIENGKVAENWAEKDVLAFLIHIGGCSRLGGRITCTRDSKTPVDRARRDKQVSRSVFSLLPLSLGR